MLVTLVILVLLWSLWNKRREKSAMDAAPPITEAEVDAVLQKMERMKLPVVRLRVDDTNEPGPRDTKIGGHPWRSSPDEVWPKSDFDDHLSFLAQLNFAQLPPITDFPRAGILQLFYRDFGPPEEDEEGGFRYTVRWYPHPEGDLQHELPDDLPRVKKMSWFSTELAQKRGLSVRPEHDVLLPNTYIWPLDEMMGFVGARRHPENDRVREIVETWHDRESAILDAYGTHWVGGHPYFAQEDPRHHPMYNHLDRLILHIGSDDHVMIGDAGTGNLMISSDDLRACRFERAFFWMDCH